MLRWLQQFFSQLFFYLNIRISFVSFKEMNGQLEFKILLLYGQNKLLSQRETTRAEKMLIEMNFWPFLVLLRCF